jgi:hypothetical protein
MKHGYRRSLSPRWITLADALTILLLALAVVIAATGGLRLRIEGLTLSLTGWWRPAATAALVAMLRHAANRDDSLWQRAKRWLRGSGGAASTERPSCPPLTMKEVAVATVLMIVATVVMTDPQIRRMDAVKDFGDPLFSLWRLAWIAHQLVRDPIHVFDANIYYPERFTLAYSDSMLVPGILAAPAFWLGIPAVPLYNVVLLSTFVFAGLAMYVLVRSLTGQPAAAMVSAMVFAFYPFRFQHYYQLELLWACWMPLTLWAIHRTLERGRLRDGAMAGAAFAAQMWSCVYFGLFLTAYVVPVGLVLAGGAGRIKHALKPLAAGAIVATVLMLPLVTPYTYAREHLGERSAAEIQAFSSKPHDYAVAQQSNMVWGDVLDSIKRGPEDSFPGLVVLVLAAAALWPPLSVTRMAYALGLVVAFDVSLGSNGFLFPVLYSNVLPFRGLRAPGRMSMLVGLSLAVLAGFAVARATRLARSRTLAYLMAALVIGLVLAESRVALTLETMPRPHDVYRWFEGRPPSVLAELPAEPDFESRYTYFSTFHWQRIINGYSGAAPMSHEQFKLAMQTFPDDAAVRFLRERGVDYIVLHEEFYGRTRYQGIIAAVEARADLRECVRAVTDGYDARIYQVIR